MAEKPGSNTGLEKELKLPTSFEARTDHEKKKVQISSPLGKSVTIDMDAFASVANVIKTFWTGKRGSLEPGTTLKIEDPFSGKSTTVVASAISDVAAALELVTKPGKYAPDHKAAEEPGESKTPGSATKTKAKSEPPKRRGRPPKQAVAEMSAPVAKPPAKRGRPKKQDAAPASAAHPKSGKAAGKTTKTVPESASRGVPPMPGWFKTKFQDRYSADAGELGAFELVRTPLALQAKGSKYVAGKAPGVEGPIEWGYEVVSKKYGHVAWVIARDEKKLFLTGIPNDAEAPQPQRVIDGVIARIIAKALPKAAASGGKKRGKVA